MKGAFGPLLTREHDALQWRAMTQCIPFFITIISFFLAWGFLGYSRLDYPLVYDSGDTAFMLWLVKRVVDGGWYFNSPYSGFPFGSVFLDFPLSDAGNFFILKLLGILTKNYVLTFNLFFLLGFPITTLVTYEVLEKLHLEKFYAASAALLFAFLPAHFLRIGHLFYTWYFSVPLFVWVAFKIFSTPSLFQLNQKNGNPYRLVLLLIFLSFFGVYYAFFSALLFMVAGLAGSVKWGTKKNIISAIVAVSIISGGILVNILPNLLYWYKAGIPSELVHRLPSESELYGLKLAQMLLPQPAHRFHFFSEISAHYNQTFPLLTENVKAFLGTLGSLGFIILIGVATASPYFHFSVDKRLQLLALFALVLFLFATIGGFSSLFALLITPLIRAWNRVSIFIGFMSIMALLICTEALIYKVGLIGFFRSISLCVCLFLTVFGLWDQTSAFNSERYNRSKNEYLSDRFFIEKIEERIPKGAVYQLPYISFPESAFWVNRSLFTYNLLRGYLHSHNLSWSFGGSKGRKGDLFFRQLAQQKMSQQIEQIKKLGFKGIYIDRRGYEDHGEAIEKKLSRILRNKPRWVSRDAQLSFFLL